MNRSVSSGKPLVKSSSIRDIPMQRSIILFESAIRSEYTKSTYNNALNRFKKHFIIKDFDSLVSIETKKIQEMIEDYVLYLRHENKSHGLIKTVVCSLELFFSMNDITLNWKKLKKMYPEKQKPMGEKPYSTEQVNQILKLTNNLKYHAFVNLMCAGGVRVGSFEEMRVKDIQDFKNGSKSVKVYAGSMQEYYTFIHSEAVKALEEYFEYRRTKGEIITPDSWVFPQKNLVKPIKPQSLVAGFSRLTSKVLERTKVEDRFETMATHGFRKRFATVLKSNKEINLSISEKLLGHSTTVQLDNVYFKPTLEVMFAEYEKAIPDLVLNESTKLKLELEKKNNQLSSLEVKDRRIEQLEDTILGIEKTMNELKSRF